MPLVVAFSGGKDSTALALRLHELEEPFKLLFTPTGDELLELHGHIERVLEMTGAEVVTYNRERGVEVPARTDCALCYGQRLKEWWRLFVYHPERYAEGEELEARTGYTFRSPGRDTWPAALKDLRAEFEAGRRPRGVDDEDGNTACRVCRF